jgi:hypothetical protein
MALRLVPNGRVARLCIATAIACFAGTGVAEAAGCPAKDVTQPFTQFGDSAFYTLLPDGGFEGGGAGWSLNGNSIAGENEKYYAHASGDVRSLRVTTNASVVSPSFCVDQDMPSLRLFAKKVNAPRGGHLRVELLYKDSTGNSKNASAGALSNGGKQEFRDWAPSSLLKLSTALPMSKLGTATVQLRITSDNGGDWLVDDVYADPRLRH